MPRCAMRRGPRVCFRRRVDSQKAAAALPFG